MKDEDIKDFRSTGRRKARRALYASFRLFQCEGIINGRLCGKTTKEPPKDAPSYFEEIWPEENRILTQLQAQHMSKDLTQNDESVLKWMCPSCHKLEDMLTEKGVSVIEKKQLWI